MAGKIHAILLIGLCCFVTSLGCVSLFSLSSNDLTQNLQIDLASYVKENKSTHSFVRYLNLAQGNAVVAVKNAPKNRGFFLIQVHSVRTNVTLSKSPDYAMRNSVTGTNVGLVEQDLKAGSTYYYYVKYEEQLSFKVFLAVVVYERTDPVPGGCNLVFNTEIAPYQIVTYNDNMVKVDAQPSSVPDRICEANISKLDMYHLYMYEGNMDDDIHFSTIHKLLTVEAIEKYGKKIRESFKHPSVRRYYSAYRGTGSAFAIIARYKNFSSAYVPAVTYACDINDWDESCYGPVSVEWKIICAAILFLGLFTCYFGHRFFKTQMFIFGFVFGGFVSYVAASVTNTLSVGESFGISLIFGLIYGAIWTILWWRFGSPIVSVFLPVAFIGYLTSCVLFYTQFGDFQIFQSDLNYWCIFFSVLVPMTVLLLVTTMYSNILACSMLGATSVIIAVDHYIGGNVHYTILNNIRRATVANFNLAIIDPPFQYRDIILCCVWNLLVFSGVYVQVRQQVGKPPFPPPSIATRRNSERTPLLSGTSIDAYS